MKDSTSKKDEKNHHSNPFQPSENLLHALETFLENVPPQRLSRNLRKMFLLYLCAEKAGLPLDFEDFVLDLYMLFEFLDEAG